MEDSTLKRSVVDELAWRPDIDAAHIGVTVKDGIVTLSGIVSSYAEKYEAERAVKQIGGVKGIAEELEVRVSDLDSIDDDVIARRALNSLSWSTVVPKDSVQVKVEKGIVTLSGQVSWQFEKSAAAAAVRSLQGVVVVVNNVALKTEPQPADVQMRIENALKRNAQLDSEAITVSVFDGTVTLEGDVGSWAARDSAEYAAWAAPGVKSVRDDLTVV